MPRGLPWAAPKYRIKPICWAYLKQQATGLAEELQEIEIGRRDLAKAINQLGQELEQQRGARPSQRYAAKIELEISQSGRCEVDLIYLIRGASWRPLYDLRLWEATQELPKPNLEMTYLGQVQQSTGEDWSDVELTLSTAQPAISGNLPEIRPWYVNLYAPPPPPTIRARKAPMPAMAQMVAGAEIEMDAAVAMLDQATPVTATIDASGAAVTYHLGARANIPSDGQPHKVTVGLFDLHPDLDYLATPKLVDAVFRRAQVDNSTEALFLAGPANVFAGDEFIGRTHLDQIAPGERFELTLGIDTRVKVKRELAARQVDKTFIGDKRRLNYGYRIEVENLRPVAETIIVRDHYPLLTARTDQGQVDLRCPSAWREFRVAHTRMEIATPGGRDTDDPL